MSIVVRFLAVVLVGSVLTALLTSVLLVRVGGLTQAVSADAPPPIVLSPLATRSIIYDARGGEMAVLYAEEDREEVALSQVPERLQTAILAIEDRDFYQHQGVNVRSAFRALFRNFAAGDIEEGGSTITQQLIKNSLLGSEQTVSRKAREAVLALRLEEQMSKEQILERYLNTVYLGRGAYGVQAGAETYFGVGVEQVGWPEAALLTALIRNPVGYDPINYPDLARKRRALVARELRAQGKITPAVEAEINAAPLPTRTFRRAATTESAQLAGASYFSEAVKQQLLDNPALGATPQERYNAVFKGGLRVRTTFDPDAQELAEDAVATLPDTKGRFTAALAAVEPKTGAVRAMVGGTDFAKQKFNYATQGWRQPGSAFKFFVLMAAFEYAAAVPNDSISGTSPCRFPDPSAPGGVYEASNAGGSRGAFDTIRKHTLVSSNCGFLRLAQYAGLDKVAALANAMGITTLNEERVDGRRTIVEGPVPDNVLSMPIGSKEVHPLNMAAAYATAANDGVYHEPYLIESVTDAAGRVLYQHRSEGQRVVSIQTARLVTEVLAANVTSGTGRNAALRRQPAAGKTGTTQDNADVWFVGYTPQLATAVWIGSPEDRTRVVIRGVTQFGAKLPAQIWKEFMEPYHRDLPVIEFAEPEPTRRGRALRYTNTVDRSGGRVPCEPPRCTRRSTTTTSRPAEGGNTPTTTRRESPTTTRRPSPTTVAPPPTSPPPTTPESP